MTLPASGYQTTASHSFRGVQAELDRSAPLEDDETVVLRGAVRARENGPLPSPAVLRLTERRLTVVRHRALGADLLCEVPRAAVLSVEASGEGVGVRFTDRDRGTAVLRLTPWSGERPPGPALRDLSALGRELAWWVGA